MGVIGNIHRNFEPQHRAQAERIAALRLAAVGQIAEATSLFDAAGQHYWTGDQEEATDDCRRAFTLLREAIGKLGEASRLSVPLTGFHVDSPKTEKARDMYLGGYEYSPESFTSRLLIQDRRLISQIEHILACESLAVDSMSSGNLEGVYQAVSVPGRELLILSSEYITELVRIARNAHEVSDIVVTAWELEGTTPKDFARSDQARSLPAERAPAGATS